MYAANHFHSLDSHSLEQEQQRDDDDNEEEQQQQRAHTHIPSWGMRMSV